MLRKRFPNVPNLGDVSKVDWSPYRGAVDVVVGGSLTPTECERLQGFPDGWTDIGDWEDENGKTRKTTDGARYKALGNSMAVPCMLWIGCRIQMVDDLMNGEL